MIADYQDRYIDVEGVRTRYWDLGVSDTPLILVHGLGSFIESWLPLIERLVPERRVIALDLIGFGRTDKPDGAYTYSFLAGFLGRFMDTLGLSRAHLCGWSLGGGTVLQFAVHSPRRVGKLILVASGGLSRRFSLGLRILTLPLVPRFRSRESMEQSFGALANTVHDPSIITGEWVALYNEMMNLPGAWEIIVKTLRAGATIFGGKRSVIDPIVSNLGVIESETLVIWGRQDRVVPFECSVVAMERIPRAELIALDRCGHAPPLEHSEAVGDAVVSFLNRPEHRRPS